MILRIQMRYIVDRKVTNSSYRILIALGIIVKQSHYGFLVRCLHFPDLVEYVKFSATIRVHF